jgi:hypothetical protein
MQLISLVLRCPRFMARASKDGRTHDAEATGALPHGGGPR